MGGAVVSPREAGLRGSVAGCTCVRVGVRGLLRWPERAEGPRGYLFQAGQGEVPRASWLHF